MKLSNLALLLSLAVSPFAIGCAGASDASVDDDDAVDEGALSAAASALVGRYTNDGSSVRPPTFVDLNLHADRTFEATIDTGIRCIQAPCPSSETLWGTFTASSKYLTLKAGQGADASDFYGRYKLTRAGDSIELTRTGASWGGWSNTLTRAAGVLPDDATKIVASSPGGGFTPPAPAGSDCAIGKQEYTLEIASRKLTWETCAYTSPNVPLHLRSGQRTLTKSQVKSITDAARAASISTRDTCGADKPFLSLSISSPAGTKEYADSFYACNGNGTFIDGIDDVFRAMRDLAH